MLKLGNRELYGSDFSWVVGEWLQDIKRPEALMVLERREWGNFYGYLLSVKENGQVVAEGDAAVGELQKRMQRVDDLYAKLYKLEKGDIGGINHGLERLRLKERKLQLDGSWTPPPRPTWPPSAASCRRATRSWKSSSTACTRSSTATAW